MDPARRFSPSSVLLVGLVLLSTLLLPAVVSGQGALVELQPPQEPPAAGEPFTTEVTIGGAEAVLGFQFDINFDPAMLAVESVALGPFISSTGRNPQALGPDMTAAEEGRVVFGGFTLGQQEGAGGDGVLATITWRAIAAGDAQISLSQLQLAGSGGTALTGAVASPLTLSVQPDMAVEPPNADPGGGLPYWVWFVLGAAAVILAAILLGRRRAPSSQDRP